VDVGSRAAEGGVVASGVHLFEATLFERAFDCQPTEQRFASNRPKC
jgi:hypothetical protein